MSKTLSPIPVGEKFGDWTVVSERQRKKYEGYTVLFVLAKCKCGKKQLIPERKLRNGKALCCKKCSSLSRIKIQFSSGDRVKSCTILGEIRLTGNRRGFEVICDCGNKFKVTAGELKKRNCEGCIKCKKPLVSNYRISETPEYRTWQGMLQRCYDSFHIHYEYYGGRGVTVCDRWNPKKGGSFENFYKDMGPRPSEDHQIDKEAVFVDNKIYGPGLVKWTTKKDNYSRRSNSVFVDFNNKKIALTDLAIKFDVDYYSLYYAIKRKHFSPEEAVNWLIDRQKINA